MTYPEMLSLSTSSDRSPKPNVGFQLHKNPLVWLIFVHFCLKTENSSVCPTNNQEITFSSKRRDTSINYHIASWKTPSLDQPLLDYLKKNFQVFVELGPFLGFPLP